MPKAHFQSVADYIESQPERLRAALEVVRDTIRKAVPGVNEVISYNMPTYVLHGHRLLHMAGWKQHFSLYGATERVVATFQDELAAYEIKKGTIRFLLSQPVPVDLIARIAKFRAKEAGPPIN